VHLDAFLHPQHAQHFRQPADLVVTQVHGKIAPQAERFAIILSQYNVGAQTRRTENTVWHGEDLLEIHPQDAEDRGVHDGSWVKLASRRGETSLRAKITDRVAPGVVYTTFHHPDTQANVVTTEYSDWATNCPEYKVTAVQVAPSNGPSEWQEDYAEQAEQSRRILPAAE
jgi:formate dehydrogenase major subunit